MKNFNNMIFDSYKDTYLWRLLIFSLEKLTLIFSLCKFDKRYFNIIKKYSLKMDDIKILPMSNIPSLSEWERFKNKIIFYIKKYGIQYFLIFRPVISTMNLTNVQFLKYEYFYLKNSNNWLKLWKNILVKKNKLIEYRFLKNIYYTGNFIHHGYLLQKYLEFSNIDFKKIDCVYEFGGGYGALGTILRRLGFNKNHYIYDFKVFNILQGFFLEIEGNKIIEDPNEYNGFYLYSDINKTFKINNNGKNNLFVATWSLSESPLDVREKYLNFLNSNNINFNYYLIGFQKQFGEVNNLDYFNKFQKNIKGIVWEEIKIDYLPNNYLLFGKRK